METKLSILFYSKTSKTTKDGLVPIYLRVTINGARFEQSTQRYISLDRWSIDTGRAKGNSEEARTINHFLDTLRQIIFSCFTGLAYIDAKRLKRSDVTVGIDGEKWIFTKRKKTDSPTRIPLLPTVLEIMEHYKNHQQCIKNDSLLPIPSNAKLNAYLKEVADICGIKKHLHFI